ncbi:hypothetical protein DYU11_01500 [Fibrisoma montanum]|uniref:GLPGLI family protein n=1 Tax=Fibrisoma montanum TaxID=2305895 RepID=A0A418MI60_9BACT|nr:hypothetical protein [Fibrisoma montanum]RIV27021.1 hypothetical protein DYU11_01500 [Fibrisoma montanum]
MLTFFARLSVVLLTALMTQTGFGQAVKSSPKAYTYLIFHKLSPGLTIQDALPVEREWRAINQAAVDEGNLIGWYMLVKQMSSNTNPTEYDYVTVIVSREMSLKGASPVAMARLYGDSVKTRMADLQKRDRAAAPVVKMEIWETVDAVFNADFAPDKTPLVVLDLMRLRDPGANWSGLVAPMKRLVQERMKESALNGWNFSRLVVPNGSEKGYGLLVARSVAGLNVLSSAGTTGLTAETAKIQDQLTRTFDVVRQEVFRITEYTSLPKQATNIQAK